MVAIDDHAVEGPLAQAPGAAAGEEIALNEVYALGGGVRDVPLPLYASDGFKRVVQVEVGEQVAPLIVRQRLQPELTGDDQPRLFAKELHQLGNHVVTRACRELLHQLGDVDAAAWRPRHGWVRVGGRRPTLLALRRTLPSDSRPFTHRRPYPSRQAARRPDGRRLATLFAYRPPHRCQQPQLGVDLVAGAHFAESKVHRRHLSNTYSHVSRWRSATAATQGLVGVGASAVGRNAKGINVR